MIDSAGTIADGQLGSPSGRIQRGSEVDIRGLLPLAVVGGVARLDQVARLQVSPSTVVQRPRRNRVDDP